MLNILIHYSYRLDWNISYWLFVTIIILIAQAAILWADKKGRMNNYILIAFSILIPGIGQSNMGYLKWGVFLNMYLMISLIIFKGFPILSFLFVIIIILGNLADCIIKIKGQNINMVLAWVLLPLNISTPGIGPAYLGNYIIALITMGLSFIPSNFILNRTHSYFVSNSGEAFAWGVFLFATLNVIIGLISYLPLLIRKGVSRGRGY